MVSTSLQDFLLICPQQQFNVITNKKLSKEPCTEGEKEGQHNHTTPKDLQKF